MILASGKLLLKFYYYFCAMIDNKVKFKPLYDWSTWTIITLVIVVCGWPVLLDADWIVTIILVACVAFCIAPFFGTWYVVEGNDLIIYMFWRPSRFPISKIKEVTPTQSLLASPATSLIKRLAITFNDRKVLKSSSPLIISPADQTLFIATLKSINPNITIK